MPLQNSARLDAIEGRSAIVFEFHAIVHFPELAAHPDEAEKICTAAEGTFRNPKNKYSAHIIIQRLGDLSFHDLVVEHVNDMPDGPPDMGVDASLTGDSILFQFSPGYTKHLPRAVNVLGILSMAYDEANRVASQSYQHPQLYQHRI